MSLNTQIRLKQSSILAVPIQNYDNDFTFIVNGEEFKTSRLVSDLISSKICQIHITDPTFNIYEISTKAQGNFTNILQLISFEPKVLSDQELPFIFEVFEKLGIESIELPELPENSDITLDNVLALLQKHEKYSDIYSKQLEAEISFASSHLSELIESKKEDFLHLEICTIESILSNEKIELNEEDDLLDFLNYLYSNNSDKYSILYEFVLFANVSSEKMLEFVLLFDINDISHETWSKISDRLTCDIKNKDKKNEFPNRYKIKQTEKEEPSQNTEGISIEYTHDKQFSGILRYLRDQTSDKIESKIGITASSNNKWISTSPYGVTKYENDDNGFCTLNVSNSWICFDFKNHKISLTNYQIKSSSWRSENWNPKNFVVEGSNDSNSWEILDEQVNCNYLKSFNSDHVFSIKNSSSKQFKYIRFRQTGINWHGNNFFSLKRVEFYGKLI